MAQPLAASFYVYTLIICWTNGLTGRERDEMLKVRKCTGEGQGSCKRCSDNGKWNSTWMCFLYKIEGLPGCYCGDCAKEFKERMRKNENC